MKKQEKCFRSTLIVTNKLVDMDDVKSLYKKTICRLSEYILLENEKIREFLSKNEVLSSGDGYMLDKKLKE